MTSVMQGRWITPFKAGLAYFLIVFAFAFLLGTVRVLLVIPAVGEIVAVLIELPVVLVISWFTTRKVVTWFRVSTRLRARLAMGSIAFAVLMAAEAGLAVFAFGRSLPDYLASFGSVAALLGLIGQVGFACIPMVQSRNPAPPEAG